MTPELTSLREQAAGLSSVGPLDNATLKWMAEVFGWTPRIDPAVAQEAITQQVELPGLRSLETTFLPAINDLLAQQGGVGSSRRAQLYGDALLDFGQTVAGERAETARETMMANLQAELSANQLKSQIAPLALSLPELRANRIGAQMNLQFPFQQRRDLALSEANQAFQQPNANINQALSFLGIAQTATNFQQPRGAFDIVKDVAGFGTSVGLTAGAAGIGPFANFMNPTANSSSTGGSTNAPPLPGSFMQNWWT